MKPLVGIVMGSASDWETVSRATATLETLGIAHEVNVISAHRTPDQLVEYTETAAERGLEVLLAAAGGAAALPGAMAAKTWLPVLGIPIQSQALNGMDSLLSMAQMPAGIPEGTLAIGNAGATNAPLLSASILSIKHPEILAALKTFRSKQTEKVLQQPDPSKTS